MVKKEYCSAPPDMDHLGIRHITQREQGPFQAPVAPTPALRSGDYTLQVTTSSLVIRKENLFTLLHHMVYTCQLY